MCLDSAMAIELNKFAYESNVTSENCLVKSERERLENEEKGSTSHPARWAWLTVHRAPQVEFKMACQKLGQMGQKNEDIWESVNSFDTGAIFRTRVCQDLSRNAFVASILSLG